MPSFKGIYIDCRAIMEEMEQRILISTKVARSKDEFIENIQTLLRLHDKMNAVTGEAEDQHLRFATLVLGEIDKAFVQDFKAQMMFYEDLKNPPPAPKPVVNTAGVQAPQKPPPPKDTKGKSKKEGKSDEAKSQSTDASAAPAVNGLLLLIALGNYCRLVFYRCTRHRCKLHHEGSDWYVSFVPKFFLP
jgi:hypothetical protein